MRERERDREGEGRKRERGNWKGRIVKRDKAGEREELIEGMEGKEN